MKKPRLGSRITLSRTQVGMLLMFILLFVSLGSVVVLAYINLTTSGAFQAGYTLTNLANVQREIIQLHMETNRLLRDRSANFELLELRRKRLDTQMELAVAEANANPRLVESLGRLDLLLSQYDYELNYLRTHNAEVQYRSSAYQFDSILDLLNKQIQVLYGNEELRFYQDIGSAIKLQRTSQTLTVGIGAFLLLFGILLLFSVGRSVSGEFERAYNLLKIEVNERRRVEDELRHQNEYLAALHETTLALMNRLDVADLLEAIVARAAQMLDTNHGYVYLVSPGGEVLERKVGIGFFAHSLGFKVLPGHGVAGQVWRAEESLVINAYANWPGRTPTPGVRENLIKAVMGVPLVSGNRVVGVIGLAYDNDSGRTFTDNEVELLKAFAQLASITLDNARLFAEAERRTLQVQTLYSADEEIYRHLKTDEVLQSLVDLAVDILHADKSASLVWNEAHTHIIPCVSRGFQQRTLEKMVFRPDFGLIGQVVTRAEPVIVQDTASDNRVDWNITYPEHIRSFVHVPIVVEGQVFGIFSVNYNNVRIFGDEDLRLILSLAQRAALAIENAQLYEQAQQAATLEERQRLARELHDAVTQTLFSASLIADVLPRLAKINPEEAERRIRELRDLTRGALAEMRTLLLELRPSAIAESSIDDLLHQLGEAMTGRARVQVNVSIAMRHDLPVNVKVALYRIAQEALNNIAKHANATHVTISLRSTPMGIELRICDDGIGFDVAQRLPDNLGLSIMRERAEAIGAQIAITSQSGQGSQICVSLEIL
ncbi:MAG: GAF domain-containing sensor histidine kinase [Anaerolineae bacterium]|nr:GAF domain-containing sensor histidine kinase [Anaerolineae bacterium]